MAGSIKNILITGGAGFIGSHVAHELINAGYGVRIMDTLEPPTHDGALPAWIDPQAEFIKGDVCKKEDWVTALQGVDAVIHLAAYADYHLDFSKHIRTNVESVALLFEVIVEKELLIKKVVAASSQAVYGEGKYSCTEHGECYPAPRPEAQLQEHTWEVRCPACHTAMEPVAEKEGDKLDPQIPYGISKVASEQLLLNLGKRYSIPVAITRVSIAIGPHQSLKHFYSGALRAFAVYAFNNEPFQMNEDAGQIRDFIDVRDVATAYRVILENPKTDFEVFNVGSGRQTHVIDLAKLVAEEAGVPFQPSLAGRFRVGDARNQPMDVSKLRELGWEPKYSLQDSVRDYLTWVREQGNAKQALDASYAAMRKHGVLKGT